MIRHYLKIAFRNMRKQKMYAAINIMGFAIGIAACIVIAILVHYELSFDSQVRNGSNVYRLVAKFYDNNGAVIKGLSFQPPLAKALKNDFPEVQKIGRLMPNRLFGGAGANQVRPIDAQDNVYEDGFTFADPELLDVLDVKMVSGDRKTALSEPFSIVISKSMADKYFPHQDAVGKMMLFNDGGKPIKIGGVMQDFPATSSMQYKSFISLQGVSFWDGEQEGWGSSNYVVYMVVKPGTNIAALEKKITTDVIEKYMIPGMGAKANPADIASIRKASLLLQPLQDVHLKSYDILEYSNENTGDIRYVWLFAAIAGFILIIAIINFLNLSTARSANRAKEVGLRKVVGSLRSGLIKQFLTESLLYSYLSFVIAIVLAALFIPVFNNISGKHLSMPWGEWWFAPLLFAAATVTGLVAGIYPSFYLSSFKPINVLKGNLSLGSKNGKLRSALVVFQFSASIILIIGTMVIYSQMQYVLNAKTGFSKDQVVMVEGANTLNDKTNSFKDELLKLPQVKGVTVSGFLPVDGTKRNGNTFYEVGKTQSQKGVGMQLWDVDKDYIKTIGMQVVEGRDFAGDMKTDSATLIINQAMAKQLGFKNPIGKQVTNGNIYTVIGVVKDFNYESMKQEVRPLALQLARSNDVVSIKINGADTKQTLAAIETVWKNFMPHQAMRYSFLDDNFAAMYKDVQQTKYIFTAFAILAIIVACLGLFALSAFMAEQRSKEVSIRKVLGASVANLFALLTGNFLRLVIISLAIAVPISWMLMNQWLQDYAYRISLTWQVFAIAGVVVLFVALFTICWQSIRAAIANPVKSLRGE